MNTPTTGMVESQVFKGTGAATGLYAYAYQIAVNNVSDINGQPTSVNSATLAFNATPTPANFTTGTAPGSATYVVNDGKVGGINLPKAAPGSVIQSPTSVAWMPGTKTGALTFQYLDATKNTGPLQARRQQRDHRRALDPALREPARQPAERQSPDHLPDGLLGPGRRHPRSARARAGDRARLGGHDRGGGPGPAGPEEPRGLTGLMRDGRGQPAASGIGAAASWPERPNKRPAPATAEGCGASGASLLRYARSLG